MSKFTLVKKDSVFGGVCTGLAKYFECDLTLVRLLVFCLVFFTGFGLFAYLALWLCAPEEESDPKE